MTTGTVTFASIVEEMKLESVPPKGETRSYYAAASGRLNSNRVRCSSLERERRHPDAGED